MKNLNNYINENLMFGGFYGTNITFPLSQKSVDTIARRLDRDLSPENLHCDGEISPAQAAAKARELNNIRAALEHYCLNNWLDTPECIY